jgi:hypothetical protein
MRDDEADAEAIRRTYLVVLAILLVLVLVAALWIVRGRKHAQRFGPAGVVAQLAAAYRASPGS